MKSILRYSAYVAVAAALLAQPAWASWQRHQDWQDGGYQPRHHLRYQPGHYAWYQPRHHVWRQARHHLRSQPRQYVWYQPQRQPWYQLQEPAWYQRWRDTAYQPQRDLGYQPRRHVWHHAPREHHYAWHYRQPSHRQVEHAAVASAGHHAGLDDMIAKHAAANNLPLALVHRVIKRESDYNPRCIYAGNYGLMQIRLGTARSLGYTGTIEGLLDPDTNMTYAVRYLAGAYRVAGGNEDRAVALYARGYNSNDGRVTARRSPTFATLWSRLASRW
jgi:soluble lytic murein transglycosylase-like protein